MTLGVSRSHLCDVEKGRKVVSPERAAAWAKLLGFPGVSWNCEGHLAEAKLAEERDAVPGARHSLGGFDGEQGLARPCPVACCPSLVSKQLPASATDDRACKEPPLLVRAFKTMPCWQND